MQQYVEKSPKYLDPARRIEEGVEAVIWHLGPIETGNKSYWDISENWWNSDKKHFENTFAWQTIGVHGVELPKFWNTNPEYWKLKSSYK